MSKIRFVTDSAADVPFHLAHELDIKVLPFMIAMENSEIADGVDHTPLEFYTLLEREERIPTHSQITPMTFLDLYEETLEQGYTDLIYTSINSKGSATNQNAHQAIRLFREEHPEAEGKLNIHILDSLSYTFSYGYVVVEAAKKAREGASAEELLPWMQDAIDHIHILFATYSLKYAKKSGRVSAAAAFLGEALGLKPIMSFPHGDSAVLSKVRGEKNVIPSILKLAKEELEPGAPYTVILGSNEEHNREMVHAAEEAFGYPPAYSCYIGGVIAVNAGSNLTGVIGRKKD